MQKLLLKVNLTMQAKSHEITEALLGIQNISLHYDTKSHFIKDIINYMTLHDIILNPLSCIGS